MLTIAGVQRFIAESRSTADLWAGSAIMNRLAMAAARSLSDSGARLVFPSSVDDADASVPNRIVAMVSPGSGTGLAAMAESAVVSTWRKLVADAGMGDDPTPGFPRVHWVVAQPDSDYTQQWVRAGHALAAVKRAAMFEQLGDDGDGVRVPRICDLSPGLPARDTPPPGMQPAQLAVANWVKRARQVGGETGADVRFPSTRGIASAPERQALIGLLKEKAETRGRVRELRALVQRFDRSKERIVSGLGSAPGSAVRDWMDGDPEARWVAECGATWLDASTWEASRLRDEYPKSEVLTAGELASARDLVRALRSSVRDDCGVRATRYLALVVQDLDGLSSALSAGLRDVDDAEAWHRRFSAELSALALAHRTELETPELLATPVYSGGDDLLFVVPARTALAAAGAARRRVAETAWPTSGRAHARPITASTAVVFFHQKERLSGVVQAAQDLLKMAKAEPKDALGLSFHWHSSATREVVLPWRLPASAGADVQVTDLLRVLAEAPGELMSPRLIAEIDRDAAELDDLRRGDEWLFRAELLRLLGRHVRQDRAAEAADAVLRLSGVVRDGTNPVPLTDVLKIAHKLGQEVH